MEPSAKVKKGPLESVTGSTKVPSTRNRYTNHRSRYGKTTGDTDGAVDRLMKRIQGAKFPGAIFIHAGAGFHSRQNEKVHLEACSEYVSFNSLSLL